MTDDIIARLREAYEATAQKDWPAETFRPSDCDCVHCVQRQKDRVFSTIAHNHMSAILAVLEASATWESTRMFDKILVNKSEAAEEDLKEAVRALRKG